MNVFFAAFRFLFFASLREISTWHTLKLTRYHAIGFIPILTS
jgi:hypothetical protein